MTAAAPTRSFTKLRAEPNSNIAVTFGLADTTITRLRWALEWADDLAARLLEATDDPDTD